MNTPEEKEAIDAEIITEEVIPADAKVVTPNKGGVRVGNPLTPEQMIREEKRKIKDNEDRIVRLNGKIKDVRALISKSKQRIKLYEKAINLQ